MKLCAPTIDMHFALYARVQIITILQLHEVRQSEGSCFSIEQLSRIHENF